MKRLSLLLIYFLSALLKLGAQSFYLPEPSGQIVSDYENLLSEDEAKEIAGLIRPYYEASSNQLMIICIPTKFVGSLTIEEYANKLFKKWQPGQKGLNNGVIMIISGSRTDSIGRKLRFEVGYGLEGALPDLLCKRIQKGIMVPKLKEHKYYEAIRSGSLAVLDAIASENKGQKIIFKNKTHSTPVFKDETGLLSLKEFTEIENELKRVDGSNPVASTVSIDEGYTGTFNSVYFMSYAKYSPLFYLSFANPYAISESDSSVKVDRVNKPGVTLTANVLIGQSEEDQKAAQIRITKLLDEGKYSDAIKEVLKFYDDRRQSAWSIFYIVITIQLLFSAFMMLFYFRMKAVQKSNGNKKFIAASKEYKIISVINVLFGIMAFPNIFSFEMIQMYIWNLSINMGDGKMYLWVAILLGFHITGLVYMFKLSMLKKTVKVRGTSGDSDSYSSSWSSSSSSSSWSSSSDYSSSDSSYSSSSDSNSDYGGGGGDSGGGGSSSDW